MNAFRQIHEELEQITKDCANADWKIQKNIEEMKKDIRMDELSLEIFK